SRDGVQTCALPICAGAEASAPRGATALRLLRAANFFILPTPSSARDFRMHRLDQEVISQLSDWLQAGKQCWLCTITQTFGSSPRPVGSLLACNEDGLHCGSLSGGCVEDDLRDSIFQGRLAKDRPERIRYGVAVEDVIRLGLPCGGTLEVVIEPIGPDSAPLYRELAERIAGRRLVRRVVDLASGVTRLEDAEAFEPLRCDEQTLRHTYGPRFRLLLVGAVQVAYYLAEMA